jgi:hypothetical protein
LVAVQLLLYGGVVLGVVGCRRGAGVVRTVGGDCDACSAIGPVEALEHSVFMYVTVGPDKTFGVERLCWEGSVETVAFRQYAQRDLSSRCGFSRSSLVSCF